MVTFVCPQCDGSIVESANYCSNCGFQIAQDESELDAGDAPVVSRGQRPSIPSANLSAPLHLFGILLLIPTAFAIRDIEQFFDPEFYGFGLDLPPGSVLLVFAESAISVIGIFVALMTLGALYGRKHGLRRFAIAMLLLVPVRFILQVLISIDLQDNELTEIAFPGLFAGILMALVWIPYFALSPRVKEIVNSATASV